ncbi:MAG: hypothetical protein AUI15_02845 [Actinobacteria bacterium 13_2_20CM_2_66_6]|nr:MAG: hypothetical protein AUI15_02845 [Actinobacteria bacterium 13_2_20CM_2_66_6]
MPLVFAAIAPHGGIAIAEACTPDERDVAIKTRAGMEELGRRFAAARPDVAIVATPHNVHIANALGVVVASRVAGKLNGVMPAIGLDLVSETQLAWRVLEAFATAGLPSAGVSFGSNDPDTAVAPMDWGVLIPLWRIALIASADHGHAHLGSGPYGFHPAAEEYDTLVTELVRSEQLDRLVDIPRAMVEDAKADSWWQLLMLHGATMGAGRAQGAEWKGTLISYEAPTYFGMLTASYVPS